MQFLTIATLFVAGLAAANPTANARRSKAHSVSTAAAAQQCGKDQKISCCNSGNGSILGLNCIMVPILAIPLLDQCSGSNVASCCSTNQDGSLNINLPCIPLGL